MIEIARDELLDLQFSRKEAARFAAKLNRIEKLVDRHALMTTQHLHDDIIGGIRGRVCAEHGRRRCVECSGNEGH